MFIINGYIHCDPHHKIVQESTLFYIGIKINLMLKKKVYHYYQFTDSK